MRPLLLIWMGLLALLATPSRMAAGASSQLAPARSPASQAPPPPAARFAIPAEPQRPGDPKAGYDALVNAGYVSCGVPWSIFRVAYGDAQANRRLRGRRGRNARLSYDMTALRTPRGVEVVTANCLGCHATPTREGVIIGLGNSALDLTEDFSTYAMAAGLLAQDGDELAEWWRWSSRIRAVSPYTRPDTIGVNPADNLAAVLAAHRDPETLAWSSEPLQPLPPREPVPADVPAWWLLRKKNALFHTGIGRGDHARLMMSSSMLCTDSVEEAERIDGYFDDVRAYLLTLRPPAWPYPIDRRRAAEGRELFEAFCSECHGTYGANESYPNLIIPLEEVGTDPLLWQSTAREGVPMVEWFNRSFYGRSARLEPGPGYVAPPLDGIWATAPYLHNGSVPTVEALLDSRKRPTWWRRSSSRRELDPVALGWRHQVLSHGKHAEPDASLRKRIYDTTLPGYSNQGHTFGDELSDSQRKAVIEYLKTL
ncbi:MAG: c-type cytochrome [Myxococcaceae bacterium]|nr:c-type cytochrome [Myxococcaceae bacterium]